MKYLEHRIYVNGKLVNICSNDFVLMNNVVNYRKRFGEENVEVKHLTEIVMDKEKEEWLKSI